jgi:3-hexulose-6-phosphate synthase/6-phospho-3-hexuloisomerase
LRREFPGVGIVADMKTMDAGRMEVELAAKAGATHVVVLGAASDSTVRDAIEAGRRHGVLVGIDLVGVADAAAVRRRSPRWGRGSFPSTARSTTK